MSDIGRRLKCGLWQVGLSSRVMSGADKGHLTSHPAFPDSRTHYAKANSVCGSSRSRLARTVDDSTSIARGSATRS